MGIVIVAIALGLRLEIQSANAILYNCFKDKGLAWQSVEDRAPLAAQYGIFAYRGTAEQNNQLASLLCPISDDNTLGYSVVTGYQKTLRTTMNSTQSTIPVTSLELKDGETLTMAMLGDRVFLTLEPGKNKEEIVMCTGITASPAQFTGCTRGLAFSGTSVSAVTANQKSHGAGSIVVISNVHYVYEQLTDIDTSQTITAPYTFTSSSPNIYYTFPLVSSTGYTGLPTQNGQLTTWYAAQTLVAGGFSNLNVSTTRGLSADGTAPEKVGINASSTTGMTFDSNGKLYQSIGNALNYTGNAIAVSTSTIVSQIATSTPTASMIPIADASGTLHTNWINYSFPQIPTAPTTTNFNSSTSLLNYYGWSISGINASNELQLSANTTRSCNSSGGSCTSLVAKRFTIANKGTIKYEFSYSCSFGASCGTEQIQRNGTTVFSVSASNYPAYLTTTTIFSVLPGDVITNLLTPDGGYEIYTKDNHIYYSFGTTTVSSEVITD